MDVDCLFQALKTELVPYLLKLLEGVGLENLDSPAATKAQIVKALKAMTRSLQYGEQVRLPERSAGVLLTVTVFRGRSLAVSELRTCIYVTYRGA